ncbi:MAG: cyclic nucleotide-binding domain-containing protein [Acidimicrobiales bacterium]
MRTRRIDRVAQRLEALGFPAQPARRLSMDGTLLHLDAGSVLCEEGERGTQAFLLLQGEVDVQLAETTLRVGSGAVIGELATLDHRRTRNATVVAAGPIEVLVYDVATYRSLAEQDDLRSRLAPVRNAA